ncbi:MAG: hypothetical protein K0R02_506 [Rickettsiaceae bacterium]|jgi:hypothetical protein|nr:hypothetical protein [Rickettsiaceae bacterium]
MDKSKFDKYINRISDITNQIYETLKNIDLSLAPDMQSLLSQAFSIKEFINDTCDRIEKGKDISFDYQLEYDELNKKISNYEEFINLLRNMKYLSENPQIKQELPYVLEDPHYQHTEEVMIHPLIPNIK